MAARATPKPKRADDKRASARKPILLLTWIGMSLLLIVPCVGIGVAVAFQDWQRRQAAEAAVQQEQLDRERQRDELRFQQESPGPTRGAGDGAPTLSPTNTSAP